MATMNISLPDDMKAFIEAEAAQQGFGTVSEYMRPSSGKLRRGPRNAARWTPYTWRGSIPGTPPRSRPRIGTRSTGPRGTSRGSPGNDSCRKERRRPLSARPPSEESSITPTNLPTTQASPSPIRQTNRRVARIGASDLVKIVGGQIQAQRASEGAFSGSPSRSPRLRVGLVFRHPDREPRNVSLSQAFSPLFGGISRGIGLEVQPEPARPIDSGAGDCLYLRFGC